MLDQGHQASSPARRSAPHLLAAIVSTALLAIGCASTVIGGGTGGSTTDTAGTGPADSPGTGNAGTGSAGTDAIAYQCTGPVGGSCDSTVYPAGETCFACSCRCCEGTPDMTACLADPTCAAWVDCIRACAGGQPCAASCGTPCDTGNEPGCYLMDCHNWVCDHACGQTP